MSQPKVAIDITANDRTAKGARSAEKRLGTVPKHVSAVTRNQDRAMREGLGRSSRSALRTLGQVEQASARVFGGRSVTSGFATRLGAIREAAAATGTGLGEAAGSASMLGSTLGVLGTVAGATVGVLAAAGFAAFKMADGWAKGAAAVGRMADTMGVARKEMQEFAAASERMGVDKGVATGGLASLSQTLNDARYGRNTGALAMLSKLGVKMQLNDDGTVNVGAMLPAIADAIARQNSSGRRTASSALGLSDALIPVFSQGGKALGDDMKDAGNTAYIASDDDIKRGQRIQRKGAMVGQLTDRAMAIAGSAAADASEPGYDATLAAGRQIVGGATTFGGIVKNTFAPAAGLIERGGRAIERAASTLGGSRSGLISGALNLSRSDVVNLKKVAATEWDKRSVPQLHGVIDTLLNRQASGRWGRTVADVANARSQFSDINGPVAWRKGRHSVEDIPSSVVSPRLSNLVDDYLRERARGKRSSVGDNLNYANPYASDRRNLAWINRLDGPSLGAGRSIHRHGTTAALERYRPGAYQVQVPEVPVRVTVEVPNAPRGTKVTSRAGRQSRPAISYAVAN